MLNTFVRGKEFHYSIFFIVLIIAFTSYDIIVDLNEGVSFDHVMHEFSILVFSVGLMILQLRSSFRKTQYISQIKDELLKVTSEREEFKNKVAVHSNFFSQAVDDQFNAWHLTASEKDIAILLIKGLSMKEIASVRNSQESTVRQQSTSIYRKSHCENRLQLAAFFLEDLF